MCSFQIFLSRLPRLQADGGRDQQGVDQKVGGRRRGDRLLESDQSGRHRRQRAARLAVDESGNQRGDRQRRHAEGGAMEWILLAPADAALHPCTHRGDHHRRVWPDEQQCRELECERRRERRPMMGVREIHPEERCERRRSQQTQEDERVGVGGSRRLQHDGCNPQHDSARDENRGRRSTAPQTTTGRGEAGPPTNRRRFPREQGSYVVCARWPTVGDRADRQRTRSYPFGLERAARDSHR